MSVTIKSAREIELIREACRIIGIIHQELGRDDQKLWLCSEL